MSNVEKFFWRWIQKNCIWVQKRERKSFSWLRALHKKWNYDVYGRAIAAKKCTKTVCCTCKVVDARSRCHHRHLWWSFLVTPTNHNTGNNSMNQPAGRRCQAREKRTSGNCDWVWFRSDWLKKWREIFEPIIKHDTEAFLRQFSLKYFCPETNAAQAASQS